MAEFTFAPLTPASFLDRSAAVFADRTAIIDGERSFTYQDMSGRCRRLMAALAAQGVGREDRVAALCANSHVMLELHHAVPALGATLVTVNVRLSAAEMAEILDHSGASLLVATHEFADRARDLAGQLNLPCFVAGGFSDSYEGWIADADPAGPVPAPIDERQLLAINYTSGTTGRPKGVMYHHRGAYLQATAMAYHARLGPGARYLWTLPMFHCNGWCFTWAVTAAGAVHICQRQIDPAGIWSAICRGEVTHLCAAPTVLTMIAEAAASFGEGRAGYPVHAFTGGAPPTPALLTRLAALNLQVTHLYGLTETYGPSVINAWQPEWDAKTESEKARLNARQGVGNVVTRDMSVIDAGGEEVPADGETLGEIVIRGNNVTIGYYRDEAATLAAEADGWFRTGDLGVRFPDGYIELRDRAKDIIITGGENVASVEIEKALAEHPAVLEAVVVGRADERWGEIPVAFVVLRQGISATKDELIEFVCGRIARFKAPREIFFEDLPKTSTGKIQKYILRRRFGDG